MSKSTNLIYVVISLLLITSFKKQKKEKIEEIEEIIENTNARTTAKLNKYLYSNIIHSDKTNSRNNKNPLYNSEFDPEIKKLKMIKNYIETNLL